MGGPKALLLVEGRPLVRHHLERLAEAGCGPMAVVVRPEVAPLVTAALHAKGPGPDLSRVQVLAAQTRAPSESLVLGLRTLREAAPEELGDVVVTPVDLLPPRVETLQRLLGALELGALAASPRHGGRGGHPAVLRAELWAPFLDAGLAMDGFPSLRELLERAGARRVRIEVDDPAVLGDFDSPEDLGAFGRIPPRFLAPTGS